MENNKKNINNEEKKIINAKAKKEEEIRDTTGDTKIFQVIRKEDIEREKRRQAIEKENQGKDKHIIQDKKTENGNILSKNTEKDDGIIVKKKEKSKVVQEENEKSKNEDKKATNQILGTILDEEKESKIETKYTNVALATNKVLEKNPVQYNNYQEKNKKVKLNDYEKNVQQKNDENKENKGGFLKVILILIILILVAFIVSTVFGVINMNSESIINRVKVNSIDVSNLSKEEAIQTLNSKLNSNSSNVVTAKRGDYKKSIKLKDIEGKFDVEDAVNSAYNIGRESDIVRNNYKTISVLITGTNVNAKFTYNEELLDGIINEISLDMPDLAIDASYIINGNKLIIKNSVDGIKIQKESFKQSLINAFSGQNKEFEVPTEKAEQQEIDIEKIHDEIYKKPIDAHYTTNPYKVYKEENGLDFAISIDEAKKLLKENKDEYEIELKEIIPNIKIADLGEAAFPDLLSTFTTTYGTGDTNRNANIALAAQSINSVVVMPGEVFSYNDLIGECSLATGYKTSTIYLNGKLSTGVGGGICQVSTTLYNAVLRANLEIVQRRNHSLGVTYVPAGQDAMVNIGTSDFKFKNNREYPIEVIAYVNPGSVTCAIRGLKQDVEYEVKLESTTIEKTAEKYKVETYKVLYLNGNVVSRTWLSTDTYKYH